MTQNDRRHPNHRHVALITGAGSGIGAACALQISALGYRVALIGRTASKLNDVTSKIAAARADHDPIDVAVIAADIADPAAARSVVREAVSCFGRLDAVINNAGAAPLKPVADHTDDDIAVAFGVNALGPIALTIEAIPHLLKSRGVVVNVSSMASQDPFPGLGVYGAAKAAMNTFSLAIANEYADQGLRAFAVAPGAVDTPLLQSLFTEDQLPLANRLQPEAVAKTIVGCITGEASDTPNGGTIWLPSP